MGRRHLLGVVDDGGGDATAAIYQGAFTLFLGLGLAIAGMWAYIKAEEAGI